MDFLAELLFELLGEVFLENGLETAADHHLPRRLRVLILIVTALVFTAVFGIILLVGIAALRHALWASLVCFALNTALAALLALQIRRVLRARPRQ